MKLSIKGKHQDSKSISEACAQFTMISEEQEKKNAHLSMRNAQLSIQNAQLTMRIAQLERTVKEKDAEMEVWKTTPGSAWESYWDNHVVHDTGEERMKIVLEKSKLARERQDLATHVSTLIDELQHYKVKLEKEVPENSQKCDLNEGEVIN